MNLNVSGKAKIFINKYGFYSTILSTKNKDGVYHSMFIPVCFKHGVNVPDKTIINIKNGFGMVSSYTTKAGEEKNDFKIMITEFDMDTQESSNKLKEPKETKGDANEDDTPDIICTNPDDLPF